MKRLLPAGMTLLLGGCIIAEYSYGTPTMSKADIVSLHRAGRTDDEIVKLLRRDGMRDPLSAGDIIELQEEGVSNRVLREAVDAPIRRPASVVREPYGRQPWHDDMIDLGVLTALHAWHWGRWWHWHR